MTYIGTDLETAIGFLKAGQLVAIPTETVYGLAGNGLDEAAVTRIFATKNRPMNNPLILHFPNLEAILEYVTHLPSAAEKLAEAFMPGSLTLVLPKKSVVPDLVTAGLPDVAIRIPDHSLTLKLLENLDFPLAAPSANPFGYISPTTAEHVLAQLGGKIPYILDGGACQKGLESTIVGFQGELPVVYRLGAIPLEALQTVVGSGFLLQHEPTEKPLTPGMLPYHYSPHTPLFLTDDLEAALAECVANSIGVISLKRVVENIPKEHQIQLSLEENLEVAARGLYGAMHALDGLGLGVIFVEKMPDWGLGKTMNDRLRRAAYKAKM